MPNPGTIYRDKKLVKGHEPFSVSELSMAKKITIKAKATKRSTNNTSGTIHSFGYGAMYHPHPITGHTIDKFAMSKFSRSVFIYEVINHF